MPDIIRGLASEDEEDRNRSKYKFNIGALHQEVIYDCVPLAIPFFIELLQIEAVQDKDWILETLSWITYRPLASTIQWMIDTDDEYGMYVGWSESQREGRTNAFEQIAKGLDIYLDLLSSEDNKIRAAVPALLAKLRHQYSDIELILFNRLHIENDVQTRASLVFCLGFLCAEKLQTEIIDALKLILAQQEEKPEVRLATAYGLILALKKQIDDKTLLQINDVMKTFPQSFKMIESMYWGVLAEIDERRNLSILYDLSAEQAHQLTEGLISAFTTSDAYLYYGPYMLDCAFLREKLKPTVYRNDLTNIQVRALNAILDKHIEDATLYNNDMWVHQHLLKYIDIYTESREDLRAFIDGKCPANPSPQG